MKMIFYFNLKWSFNATYSYNCQLHLSFSLQISLSLNIWAAGLIIQLNRGFYQIFIQTTGAKISTGTISVKHQFWSVRLMLLTVARNITYSPWKILASVIPRKVILTTRIWRPLQIRVWMVRLPINSWLTGWLSVFLPASLPAFLCVCLIDWVTELMANVINDRLNDGMMEWEDDRLTGWSAAWLITWASDGLTDWLDG